MKGEQELRDALKGAGVALDDAAAGAGSLKSAMSAMLASGGMQAKLLREHLDAVGEAMKKGLIDPARGIEIMGKAVQSVRKKMQEMGAASEKAARKSAEAWATTKGILTGLFAGAAATITGFVRAGFSGSTVGNSLAISMQLLSREIAALFLPAMNRAITVIRSVTDWFRSLSARQQESIGKTLLVAFAIGTLLKVIPGVVAGIRAIGVAIQAAELGTGVGAILAVVGALAALALTTDQGQKALAGVWEALKPIGNAIASIAGPLEKVGGFLWDAFVAGVGLAARGVQFLIESCEPLFTLLADLIGLAQDIGGAIAEAFGAPAVGGFLETLGGILSVALKLVNPFYTIPRLVSGLIALVRGPLLDAFNWVVSILSNVFRPVVDSIAWVFERIKDIVGWIADKLEWLGNLPVIKQIVQAAQWVGGAASSLLGSSPSGSVSAGRPPGLTAGQDHHTVDPAPGGFERVEDAWRRFQLAAVQQNGPAQQTAANTQQTAQTLQQFWNWVQGGGVSAAPAVAGPV